MTTIPVSTPALTHRVRRILVHPRSEWGRIAGEALEPRSLWLGWVIPLAAIGPIATILGALLFGFVPFAALTGWGLRFAVRMAVVNYLGALVVVALLAWLIPRIAPRFGGTVDQDGALKVAAFSGTAAWVAGIFRLVPPFAPLAILGVYSLYLLYVGLEVVAKVPKDRLLTCEVTLILAGAAVMFLISLVVPGI